MKPLMFISHVWDMRRWKLKEPSVMWAHLCLPQTCQTQGPETKSGPPHHLFGLQEHAKSIIYRYLEHFWKTSHVVPVWMQVWASIDITNSNNLRCAEQPDCWATFLVWNIVILNIKKKKSELCLILPPAERLINVTSKTHYSIKV